MSSYCSSGGSSWILMRGTGRAKRARPTRSASAHRSRCGGGPGAWPPGNFLADYTFKSAIFMIEFTFLLLFEKVWTKFAPRLHAPPSLVDPISELSKYQVLLLLFSKLTSKSKIRVNQSKLKIKE